MHTSPECFECSHISSLLLAVHFLLLQYNVGAELEIANFVHYKCSNIRRSLFSFLYQKSCCKLFHKCSLHIERFNEVRSKVVRKEPEDTTSPWAFELRWASCSIEIQNTQQQPILALHSAFWNNALIQCEIKMQLEWERPARDGLCETGVLRISSYMNYAAQASSLILGAPAVAGQGHLTYGS